MSAQWTSVDLASPFKGLAPFDDSDVDAQLFFGREWETEVVAANVLASRLTVLYGPSGVGKSSLLRAGVVRTLRQSSDPSPAVVYFGTWAGEPLAGLEEAARAAVADALGRDPVEAPGGLTDRFAAWSAELGAELCLLIDHLEELFLYHPAKQGAAGFVDLLPELVLRPGLRVNVLIGVRDDSLAELDVFKERIPALFMNSLRLDHLDREAGRAAILGPLGRFAVITGAAGAMEIEPELVDEVLDEVAAGRIEPSIAGVGAVEGTARVGRIETPYLQLVLQRLWEVERWRGSEVMRVETLRSLGGAERIVQSHLERALRALSPAERAVAASVFGHLVTPSGSKIAHGTSDLATYAAVEESEIKPMLDALAGQRILRPLGENGHTVKRYEIFHDVLAGAVLAWSSRHEANVALEEERKRRRRLGWLAAVALIGLALMAALAAYAFSQRSEAQKQKAHAASLTQEQKERERARKAQVVAALRKQAALEQTLEAERADAYAETQKQKADDLNRKAQRQKQIASSGGKSDQTAKRSAEKAAARAKDQAVIAEAAKRTADDEAKRAEAANIAARVAAARASARSYIARSVSLVRRDPEESARAAVQASEFGVKSTLLDAENALRAALVAMHVQHILPGAGSDAAHVARFSADGTRAVVAVGENAPALRVYRTEDGKHLQTFTAGTDLRDAALSRDGRFVAAAGGDGRVWVWDVNSRALRKLRHGPPVATVVWSPAADLLVSVGGTEARLWNISTRGKRSLRPQTYRLNAAVFSPDGQRVATYGEGPLVRIFDVDTASRIQSLSYEKGALPVMSAEFGPQGDVIVTGRGNTARLWDIDSRQYETFKGQTGPVLDVAISENGERVATGSFDALARVFTADSGVLEDSFPGHTGLGINDIDFSPEQGSTAIVTAGADHTARVFSHGQRPVTLLGHTGAVLGASFSPDGRSVLTSSEDGAARLFDPNGEPIPRVLADYGASGGVTSVAVEPTRSLIAVGGRDGAVHVLSSRGRRLPTPLSRGGSPVVSIAWARGSTLLVATRDGRVRIWGNAGASRPQVLEHGSSINAAAISPDGILVATAGTDRQTRVWHVASKTSRALPYRGAVGALAFDPTGQVLATASGQAAYTWSTRSTERLKKFQPDDDETGSVTAVAFGDRGRLLATASGKALRAWNAKTAQPLKTFVRHGTKVRGVAFSPDGRWLASITARKGAVWQVGDSNLSGNFLLFTALPLQHQELMKSVAFARNHTVVMGNEAGQVLAYRCRLCGGLPQLTNMAKEKLGMLEREAAR